MTAPLDSVHVQNTLTAPWGRQPTEAEPVGGQTHAQVGLLAHEAGMFMHERDVPEPGVPPLKL